MSRTLFALVVVIAVLFTTALAQDFTFNLTPSVSNAPSDLNDSTGTWNFAGVTYTLTIEVGGFTGTFDENDTENKQLNLVLPSMFDPSTITAPVASPSDGSGEETTAPVDPCTPVVCSDNESNVCITYILSPDQQAVLTNNESVTIQCLSTLKAIQTTTNDEATATISAVDSTTPLFTATPITSDLFPTATPTPVPTLTISPQLVLPNTDFTYKLQFVLEKTAIPASTEDIQLTFFTNYSVTFNITTCQVKGSDGSYSPMGVTETVEVNQIDVQIDPAYFLLTNNQLSLDMYCTMHAAMDSSYTNGGLAVLYIPATTDAIPVILNFLQTSLPDIAIVTSGIRVDYHMNQVARWFLSIDQINQIKATTQRLLASGQLSANSLSSTTATTSKLTFTCEVIELQREFFANYPYPGSSDGYWEIPLISLYCYIATSQGQTTDVSDSTALTYMQQTYQDSLTRLWLLKDIMEGSTLWQLASQANNIVAPAPSDDDDEGEEEKEETAQVENPTIFANGTIYDPTTTQVEWTSLQLFRVGTYELPTHCFNGEQDEGEVDVDCGGAGCPLCLAGAVCVDEGHDAGKNTNNTGGCLFTCIKGVCSENKAHFVGNGVVLLFISCLCSSVQQHIENQVPTNRPKP